MQNKLK